MIPNILVKNPEPEITLHSKKDFEDILKDTKMGP